MIIESVYHRTERHKSALHTIRKWVGNEAVNSINHDRLKKLDKCDIWNITGRATLCITNINKVSGLTLHLYS